MGRSKPTGLPWGQITDDYVANGGELTPEIWSDYKPPKPVRRLAPVPAPVAPKPATRNGPHPRTAPDIERNMVLLYEQGESTLEIAKLYNRSVSTVNKVLRRRGATMRTKSESMRLSRARR